MKILNYIIISLVLIVTSVLTGCSLTDQQEVKSSVQNTSNSPEVQSIRNMTTNEGSKLGDLFDAGMGSPSYELYDPAEDGNTYVTIKGNMIYKEVPVVVTLQYKKINDDEYEFYTLTTNDIPVNEIEASQFFEYFKSEYTKKENEKSSKVVPSKSNELDEMQSNNSEVSNSTDNKIDKETLFWILSMSKDMVSDVYGTEFEIIRSGAEGAQDGYYYKQRGISIIFTDDGNVGYVDCNENVDIDGATAGMSFIQIKEKLGEAKIEENWMETPDNKIYQLKYEMNGHTLIFESDNKEGNESRLTAFR